jgi:hypothetical protein
MAEQQERSRAGAGFDVGTGQVWISDTDSLGKTEFVRENFSFEAKVLKVVDRIVTGLKSNESAFLTVPQNSNLSFR